MNGMIAAFLLQATAASSPSNLGFLSAQALADRCNTASAADISYCYAFITGIHDTMRAYEAWLNLKEFCPSVGITQGELRRAVLGYLSAYPENSQGQAASLVVVALKTSYPCITVTPAPTPPTTLTRTRKP
jgi:hypothetical protein